MSRAAPLRRLPSLAILDWGIGGVGVAAELARRRPEAGFVYVSDAGFTPYGKVPNDRLRERLSSILRWLGARGVTHAAIACNAASTAVDGVREGTSLVLEDVIEHGVRAVVRARVARIGVIGGERTIRSGVFRRRLPAIEVVQRVAQPLSAFVERGVLRGEALERALDAILAPMRDRVPALLLACTHYPAIRDRIAAHLPGTVILDPAARMAARLAALATEGPRVALTTGDAARTRAAARAAFGFDLGPVQGVGRRSFESIPKTA